MPSATVGSGEGGRPGVAAPPSARVGCGALTAVGLVTTGVGAGTLMYWQATSSKQQMHAPIQAAVLWITTIQSLSRGVTANLTGQHTVRMHGQRRAGRFDRSVFLPARCYRSPDDRCHVILSLGIVVVWG